MVYIIEGRSEQKRNLSQYPHTQASKYTNMVSEKDRDDVATANPKSSTRYGTHTSTSSTHDGLNTVIEAVSHKIILNEADCYGELGFSWPSWKKWLVLSVIFIVQVSMNLNTSLYSNGIGGISEEFGVSAQAARCGAMIFLATYAFGCELWAPFSEEFGRKPTLQASLFLVNIWQIPVALAPNFTSLMVGRALGGICSAGGSVTLGMVADLFVPDNQQYAVNYVVLSSVSVHIPSGRALRSLICSNILALTG